MLGLGHADLAVTGSAGLGVTPGDIVMLTALGPCLTRRLPCGCGPSLAGHTLVQGRPARSVQSPVASFPRAFRAHAPCLGAKLFLVHRAALRVSKEGRSLTRKALGPQALIVVSLLFQPQKGKLTPSPVDFTITPETLQNVKEVACSSPDASSACLAADPTADCR